MMIYLLIYLLIFFTCPCNCGCQNQKIKTNNTCKCKACECTCGCAGNNGINKCICNESYEEKYNLALKENKPLIIWINIVDRKTEKETFNKYIHYHKKNKKDKDTIIIGIPDKEGGFNKYECNTIKNIGKIINDNQITNQTNNQIINQTNNQITNQNIKYQNYGYYLPRITKSC